ncbi:hypothetical protein K7432_013716 [Basidiobolus ranarum]|uniref:Carbohydrate kinase PfkB domain-containing protein n=1 Tax=Basidiobolus ranarum TaxID=34480 RepID=A0ABR2WIS6_9FUNG
MFWRNVYAVTKSLPRAQLVTGNIKASSVLARSIHSVSRSKNFVYSPEVIEAINKQLPIVALESTIISHGMPYPQNLETAKAVENIVRENKCVPATIAILDGKVHIGLDEEHLQKLASLGTSPKKTSRRDIATVVSEKSNGSTTVSGTMVLAHNAGIKVFVTGGIGGVHRGAENTMDISADLTELGRTPVAVVCAGCKSILDIEKTLEFLETQGVTVTTFGEGAEFPAFFTPKSGFKSPSNSKSIEACASLIKASIDIDMDSGIVIANPINQKDAADTEQIQAAIDQAVRESVEQNIQGKEATPFLLQRVNALTGGNSLKANIALVKNNATIGSKIAYELNQLLKTSNVTDTKTTKSPYVEVKPMVIGGCALDVTSTMTEELTTMGTSIRGKSRNSLGGVGCNIAQAIYRLGLNPTIISAVGSDSSGDVVRSKMNEIGLNTTGIATLPGYSTAVYNAVHDKNGDLIIAVADMEILDNIPSALVKDQINEKKPKFVCFDGNISPDVMTTIAEECQKFNIPALFEPTSVPKSLKLLINPRTLECRSVKYITPNNYELQAMSSKLANTRRTDLNVSLIDAFSKEFTFKKMESTSLIKDSLTLLPWIDHLLIKLGGDGVLLARRIQSEYANTSITAEQHFEYDGGLYGFKHFHGIPNVPVVNVTGAGDSFVGAFTSGLLVHGHNQLEKTLNLGQLVATLTLQSHQAVSEKVTPELLKL